MGRVSIAVHMLIFQKEVTVYDTAEYGRAHQEWVEKLISYLVVTDNYILKEGDECCFGLL